MSVFVAALALLMLWVLVETWEHGRCVTARAARGGQDATVPVDRVALRASAAELGVVLAGFDLMTRHALGA